MFIRFCVCPIFPLGIEGGMWDVIILIPDHCLSIYLDNSTKASENWTSGQGGKGLLRDHLWCPTTLTSYGIE